MVVGDSSPVNFISPFSTSVVHTSNDHTEHRCTILSKEETKNKINYSVRFSRILKGKLLKDNPNSLLTKHPSFYLQDKESNS